MVTFDFCSAKKIEQKGMTFDHDFCYSFSFSSSLLFLGGKRKGGKNNQGRDQKACLSAGSAKKYQQRNKQNK